MQSTEPPPTAPFALPGLSPPLLRAMREAGYSAATAIQAAAIPPALAGRDVLGSAATGSGKTAAFILPILQWFDRAPPERPRALRALILVPTRELAAQVAGVARALAQYLPHPPHLPGAVKVTVLIGGVSINPQMLGLRGGTDIVVATPGRLLDLVAHHALRLDQVTTLVLDEADRLLDLGFADELGRILALLPPQRQNLFFSATLSPAVERLAEGILHDPVRIAFGQAPAAPPVIVQRAIAVDATRRTQLLRHLLKQNAWPRVLVFVASQYASETLATKLRGAGVNAEPFHGDLSQGKRTQVMADFKASRLHVVVATDLAARGLDIVDLPVVVNFDLPRGTADYVHRIGRTGRAGESGVAISFVSAATEAHFQLIRKRQRAELPLEYIKGFEPAIAAPAAAPAAGGVKGARRSRKDKLRAAAAGLA
jgi:superfamily II DNA/RNA helicase